MLAKVRVSMSIRYNFHGSSYPWELHVRVQGEKGTSRTSFRSKEAATAARSTMAAALRKSGADVRFTKGRG